MWKKNRGFPADVVVARDLFIPFVLTSLKSPLYYMSLYTGCGGITVSLRGRRKRIRSFIQPCVRCSATTVCSASSLVLIVIKILRGTHCIQLCSHSSTSPAQFVAGV